MLITRHSVPHVSRNVWAWIIHAADRTGCGKAAACPPSTERGAPVTSGGIPG